MDFTREEALDYLKKHSYKRGDIDNKEPSFSILRDTIIYYLKKNGLTPRQAQELLSECADDYLDLI